jgi:hypothetical protein
MNEEDDLKCTKCGAEEQWFGEYCLDCWPGYDLCKACRDYRCEHFVPDPSDLDDPEFTSCHCENKECREGFIEGSEYRIITQAEFSELQRQWREEESSEHPSK